MRARLAVSLLAGLAVAIALPSASSSSRPPVLQARTLTVHVSAAVIGSSLGPVGGIALDGTQAAYVRGVAVSRSCALGQRLYRWDLASGKTSPLSGASTCAQPTTSTGVGISQIALADSHAAWLVSSGGNLESDADLFASTTSAGRDKHITSAVTYWDGQSCSTDTGTAINGLVSDGSSITYATWSIEAGGTVTGSSLWRISGSSVRLIAGGSGVVVAASADGGRVALLRTDGTIAIYGSDGTLLQTIAGAASVGCSCCFEQNVALTGGLVAVVTAPQQGAPGRIDVYDRTSGALLHSWTKAVRQVWKLDAYAGIAVYAGGSNVHALDLRTGKDVVVARAARAVDGVRLDRAGLLYFLNLAWSAKNGQDGKLVFVPYRTIAAKLAG